VTAGSNIAISSTEDDGSGDVTVSMTPEATLTKLNTGQICLLSENSSGEPQEDCISNWASPEVAVGGSGWNLLVAGTSMTEEAEIVLSPKQGVQTYLSKLNAGSDQYNITYPNNQVSIQELWPESGKSVEVMVKVRNRLDDFCLGQVPNASFSDNVGETITCHTVSCIPNDYSPASCSKIRVSNNDAFWLEFSMPDDKQYEVPNGTETMKYLHQQQAIYSYLLDDAPDRIIIHQMDHSPNYGYWDYEIYYRYASGASVRSAYKAAAYNLVAGGKMYFEHNYGSNFSTGLPDYAPNYIKINNRENQDWPIGKIDFVKKNSTTWECCWKYGSGSIPCSSLVSDGEANQPDVFPGIPNWFKIKMSEVSYGEYSGGQRYSIEAWGNDTSSGDGWIQFDVFMKDSR